MGRSYRERLEDIALAITDVETFTVGFNSESFAEAVDADRKTILAITASFIQIGEACRALPETFRSRHSHIPWHRIIGLRNILVHEYFRRDTDVIWEVIAGGHLAILKAAVEDELR